MGGLILLLLAPFLGFVGLVNGLAIVVKEQGPHVPPQYEAAYKQVAFEKQVPWALLAAWDGAENRFALPVPTQQTIYERLVDEALEQKRQFNRELCETHPGDPRYCPPPEPSLDPEELIQLFGMAYRIWYAGVLNHLRGHADYILTHRRAFEMDPEAAFRAVMSIATAAKAAELYEGYQVLEELDQLDYHASIGEPPSPPPGWRPAAGFAWPADGPITSRFGRRLSPIDGQPRFHTGLDIGLATGTEIVASRDGVVMVAEYDPTYGLMVVLEHGGPYRSLYAHASALTVSPGDTVKQGQTIAYAGSTGMSTGSHLHLEIHYLGTPVDPLLLLGR